MLYPFYFESRPYKLDSQVPLEDTTVDAAKSTIVYNIASAVSKPKSAVCLSFQSQLSPNLRFLQALTSFVNQALKGVSQNYNRILLEKYQAVTKDDILSALEKYVLPLFNPESSVAVLVTAPGKVESTVEGMSELGFDVEIRELESTPEDSTVDSSEYDSGSESESGSDSSGRQIYIKHFYNLDNMYTYNYGDYN